MIIVANQPITAIADTIPKIYNQILVPIKKNVLLVR